MGPGEVMADAPPPPPPGFTVVDAPPPPPGFKLQQARANPRAASYSAGDLAASKLTMGLADKVAAGGQALGGYLGALLSGRSGPSVGGRYDAASADETAAKAAYKAEHPVVDWATSPLNLLVGGPGKAVAGIAAGASPAAIAAARSAAVKAGVVSGTAVGALSGAGASSGSLGDQAGQIALSSGVGAVTGGAAARYLPDLINGVTKKAAPYAQRLMEAAAPAPSRPGSIHSSGPGIPMPGMSSNPARSPSLTPARAQQIIADNIAADGSTPRQVGRTIADAQRRGVPLAIMDTGDNVRGLASAVSRQPGPSRTVMRDAAIARQEGQTDRVQSAIERDLGNVADRHEQSQAMLDTARRNAKPLYEAAYAKPVEFTAETADLLRRPSLKAALSNAKSIAQEEGRDPTKLGFLTHEDGTVELPTAPTMQTMDYVKRGLDDVLEKYRDTTTGKLVLDTKGHAVESTRKALIAHLDDMNPDYKAARAAYAGPVRANAAMLKGNSALNKTASDIAADIKDMTPFDLEHYRLGLRSALSDRTEALVDGADKSRALLGSPKKRNALSKAFGGEEGFDNFLKTLADEGQTSATYGRMNTGSATAANQADDASVLGESGIGTSVAKAGFKAALGHHIGAITGLIGDANDRVARKAGEGVRTELAAALSETDPIVLAEALRMAQRSRAINRLSARRAQPAGRAGALAAARGGSYVASLLSPER